ncbi:UDP-forming cellulose synthase catalytic subunit [Labrenzia sp. 011]|uniref:UDP-forming cellulose synthase catalytic subunit n=1 Tax=Labrenzia sp. 011 TaxID=2171494 RepID=UPI000D5195E5|nr:UDP-forming cellulose synthase catalytic subunit [Labrenzia sp. 011]PVB60305.1 cellulose synthase catalytic subunit (UDP-forming) [Labrenzia sp. 011]
MINFFKVTIWAILAFFYVLLVTLPISSQAQLSIDVIILVSLVVLKLLAPKGSLRIVVLAFGSAIILRYLYWRTTSTLPPVTELQDFIPGILVYVAELYSIMMLGLSMFIVAMPLDSRPQRRLKEDEEFPTVDIFIPTYNEDEELLASTISAAKGIEYPPEKVEVWLLDDGGTLEKRSSSDMKAAHAAQQRHESLKLLCENLGAHYLTRDKNEHAKAGNLNNALAHSSAEVVVVFDADHAPSRDFLLETVGYFNDDPKLFLVQTPHFFLNPDPLERNLQTFKKMPSENEMFYGIIQRGLDKWNASFFCGSAALLRRKALEETNGFSGVTITEDCETAVNLHARGWNSIYIDRPLIAGLQPATFSSFIGQRSRWAQGMMQILRFHFPLLKFGLSFPQMLCYLSSSLFWLFPFARMIFLVAPLCYLFFDLQIFDASGRDFFVYTSVYMVVNMLLQNYLYGRFRWPLISELYEYIQTVHLLPAVVSVILNPSKPTFKVTAKDESISESRLSELSLPFFIIFVILLVGVAVSLVRLFTEPYKADITVVVGAWNLLNVILAGCALGVVSERGERQSTQRVKVSRKCEVKVGGEWLPATISDVSVRGAGIEVLGKIARTISEDDEVEIRIVPLADLPENILPVKIRHTENTADGVIFGCEYVVKNTQHNRIIADLVFANSAKWSDFQKRRRTNPGVVGGTMGFLRIALRQTARGISYFMSRAGKPKTPVPAIVPPEESV